MYFIYKVKNITHYFTLKFNNFNILVIDYKNVFYILEYIHL